MNASRKIAFYLLLLTVAVGCVDDYPLISRDSLAADNELLDALMRVVDEDTAKDYTRFKDALTKARGEIASKRLEKWKANLEKKETKDFEAFLALRDEYVKKNVFPEPDAFAGSRLPAVYYRVTRETVAMQRAKKRETNRLENVVADLVHRKILELEAAGVKKPSVSPAQEWPTLYEVSTSLAKSWQSSQSGQPGMGGMPGAGGMPGGKPGK